MCHCATEQQEASKMHQLPRAGSPCLACTRRTVLLTLISQASASFEMVHCAECIHLSVALCVHLSLVQSFFSLSLVFLLLPTRPTDDCKIAAHMSYFILCVPCRAGSFRYSNEVTVDQEERLGGTGMHCGGRFSCFDCLVEARYRHHLTRFKWRKRQPICVSKLHPVILCNFLLLVCVISLEAC